MAYSYTNPGWNNLNPPPFNAVNLNNISTLLAALGSAFDNGGDPAYIYGTASPLGTSWATALINLGQRGIVSTSGTIGALTVTCDTDYILTAASTVTLPASPIIGQRLTFKAKTTATSTITANAAQTIGTTTSTSFVLYAQEDYVTLEWDGTSIWYVVATNGPILSSNQNGATSCNSISTWTAIGNGLSLSIIQPGIYDIDIDCTLGAAGYLGVAIGNSITPISSISCVADDAGSPGHSSVKAYILSTAALIQGIYYSTAAGGASFLYQTYSIGRITARRIG